MKKSFLVAFIVFAQLSGTKNAFSQSVNLTTSNLPIIVINTNNNTAIVDEPKVKAHMGIISNTNGINNITDAYNDCDG